MLRVDAFRVSGKMYEPGSAVLRRINIRFYVLKPIACMSRCVP